MLVNLTINDEGVRAYYDRWVEFYKEQVKEFDKTYEEFRVRFTPVDGESGFYLYIDRFSPMRQLQEWYNEFTQTIGYEDEFKAFPLTFDEHQMHQYGLADTIDQIKEYYKEQIEDPDTKWVIFVEAIKYHPENAGKTGGFRPYKSGIYIGQYDEIRDCEYYDDCEFDDDYQGYLIHFHIIPVK